MSPGPRNAPPERLDLDKTWTFEPRSEVDAPSVDFEGPEGGEGT
jgi:hypothetical protein